MDSFPLIAGSRDHLVCCRPFSYYDCGLFQESSHAEIQMTYVFAVLILVMILL